LNRNKIHYPFRYSKDRRLNFTLAHELGHIFLGHLSIADRFKSALDKEQEDILADEFAGRLLMPEKLLYTCNYYSLDQVPEHFNVSRTALKVKLMSMDRLDLLTSRKISTCSRCGNTKFTANSDYCFICGQPLWPNPKGIQRVYYTTTIVMDKYKRVLVCPKCGKDVSKTAEDICPKCKTHLYNLCSCYLGDNPDECSFADHSNARYCEVCGKESLYLRWDF
jgi:ribosomal protein L37E